MLRSEEFKPVQKVHNNRTFTGRPVDSVVTHDGIIKDLPITDDGETLNSCWTCQSIWERFKFLFHGEITVRVMSKRHPAIAIQLGDTYREVKEPHPGLRDFSVARIKQ